MRGLDQLEKNHDRLDAIIRASEGWAPRFNKTPDHHAEIIKIQNRLERKLRRYFRDLAQKSSNMVRWDIWYKDRYLVKAADDYDIAVSINGSAFEADATVLIGVIYDQIAAGVLTGAQAEQELISGWLGVTKTSSFISEAAVQRAGNLIKGIQETTRRDIARSIQTSIKLGEDQAHTVERLMEFIDDPVRARMIARTEAVRAFNSGIMEYGRASGAETKRWDTTGAGCPNICALIDREPIPMEANFEGGGGSYDFPPAHPNCQCSVIIGYGKIDQASGEVTDSEDYGYE